MAHEVIIQQIRNLDVSSVDVVFDIKGSEGKLGTLTISKGGMEWIPSGNSVTKAKMDWTKFSKVMNSYIYE